MSNTINISLRDLPLNKSTAILDNFIYKGSSEVILDLTGVSEEVSRVRNITIDWGDGSDREFYTRQMIFEYRESSIISEITTGLIGGGVLGAFTHQFIPVTTHITDLTIQVLVNYDNGDHVLIQQPITLIQESYYDNIKEFGISNASIHDDTTVTFANLQSQYNDWTWPVYLTQEDNVETETVTDPFADFDCDLKFASLSVVKSIINPADAYSANSVINYAVRVINSTDRDINSCTLTDSLSPIQLNNQIAFDFMEGKGIVRSKEEVSLLYSYTVTESDFGTLDNRAVISSPSLRNSAISNIVSVDISQPLQIEKITNSGEDSRAGEYVSYTVNVTNPNPVVATNAILTDSLPISFDNITSGDESLFEGVDIPGNTTLSVTYEYQITVQDTAAGSLVNTATLTSNDYDTISSTVTISLEPLQALEVAKSSSSADVRVGETLQYTVLITNPNAAAVNNVTIADSLPISVSDVVAGDAGLFTGITIPGSSTATVTYSYTVPESYINVNTLTNTVNVTSDEITQSSSATLNIPITPLDIYKFKINTANLFKDPSSQLSFTKQDGSIDVRTVSSSVLASGSENERVFSWIINNPYEADIGAKGATNIDQFKLPLVDTGEYDFYIYWGDGSSNKITSYNDPNITHTYDTTGEKTITIYGKIKGWSFNNEGDRLKYVDTLDWSALDITGPGAFYGCENYTGAYSLVNNINTPYISTTDLSDTFAQCTQFNGAVDNWNISGVLNLSRFFTHCFNFNQPIDSWDVSSVTSMYRLFMYNTRFNQPLLQWDVRNVVNMSQLLDNARSFNQPLDQWEPYSLAGPQQGMFSNTFIFNQDLNTWSQWISGVTDASFMFKRAFAFNGNISDWDVSSVRYFNQTFACDGGSGNFNSDISGWQPSSCTNYQLMFWDQPSFNRDIGGWSQFFNSNITTTGGMFLNCELFNQNLDTWGPKMSSVSDFSLMFSKATNFNNGEQPGLSGSPMNTWDISNVSNNGLKGIFSQASSFNQNLDIWGPQLGNITNTADVFNKAVSFNQNLDTWGPYLSGVVNMSLMFAGTTVFNNGEQPGLSTSPMDTWDVSSVENMYETFARTPSFNQNVNTWDVSNVTNMHDTFEGANVYNQPLDSWDVSNVTTMKGMFDGAFVFDQSLNTWDVGNVTIMDDMFDFCGISDQNFSNAIVSWSQLSPNLQSNVVLGADNNGPTLLNTQAVNDAVNTLTNTHSWTINDTQPIVP